MASKHITCAARIILATLLANSLASAATMESVRVSKDGKAFVLQPSKRPFVPWGVNYLGPKNKLIEDCWDTQWPQIERDFAEMKRMGANVVRIHLELPKFMDSPDKPNEHALAQLDRVLKLAEANGLYLDITGLACYHTADVPAWYDNLNESQRWQVQGRFWQAVAQRGVASPAVFCYDLMNEPVSPGGKNKPGQWYSGKPLGENDFVQWISLDRGDRPREQVSRDWVRQLTAVIRKSDPNRMVTVGLMPTVNGVQFFGFWPELIAPEVDFISVHIYPEKGKVADAMQILRQYAVGKPVVIEETFPLACSKDELRQFLLASRGIAAGWMGHYDGTSRAELEELQQTHKITIGQNIWLHWIELFEELTPVMRDSSPTFNPTQEAIATFDARRKKLLDCYAALKDLKGDLYGDQSIAWLAMNKEAAAANAQLLHVAQWFERPHDRGRDQQGECDFTAVKLTRAYHMFGQKGLEPATLEAVKKFFLTHNFESHYTSENHILNFHTARYLMAQAWPDETFGFYNKTGRELLKEDRQWLDRYIRYRARESWGEFDSSCYMVTDWESLSCLVDFAKDADLARLAHMMMDVRLADTVVDSLNGMIGGAQGRSHEAPAMDHASSGVFAITNLYFGAPDFDLLKKPQVGVDSLLGTYRPDPLVVQIALERHAPYENKERKYLHNVGDALPEHPLDGSIRKYTWLTPDYVMGCVQQEDPYPAAAGKNAWYAYHQQHDWDLTLGTTTKGRIFTHHPGTDGRHEYWDGDSACGCGHFFQNKNVMLALYDIPQDQAHGFIHAYLPKSQFQEVVEENGFIFVRNWDTFIALKMFGGNQWTKEGTWKDVEVQSPGRQNGAICEVGNRKDYGDFAAFRKEIAANKIEFKVEPAKDGHAGVPHLTYASKRGGTFDFDAAGKRMWNGKAIDTNYAMHDCPFMKSAWQSGIVELRFGDRTKVFDFTK